MTPQTPQTRLAAAEADAKSAKERIAAFHDAKGLAALDAASGEQIGDWRYSVMEEEISVDHLTLNGWSQVAIFFLHPGFGAAEFNKVIATLKTYYPTESGSRFGNCSDEKIAALQTRLAASESEVAGLRAALEGLLDEQNGVPLFTREKEYLAAVEAARTALRPAHTQTKGT